MATLTPPLFATGRPLEAVQHCFVFGSLAHAIAPSRLRRNVLGLAFHSTALASLGMCLAYEGLRLPQLLVTPSFIAQTLTYCKATRFYTKPAPQLFKGSAWYQVSWLLATLAWTKSVYFASRAGASDFSLLESQNAEHPYAVGVKYVTLTDKQLEASIFYPVDKTFVDCDDVMADSRMLNMALWTEDEYETMAGEFSKSLSKTFFKVDQAPKAILRFIATRRLPAVIEAELADRFQCGEEELRPIVFSHGLSASKCMYSAVYHKMAANGHLVVAFNHQDESCVHTVDKYGNHLHYVKTDYFDADYRQR